MEITTSYPNAGPGSSHRQSAQPAESPPDFRREIADPEDETMKPVEPAHRKYGVKQERSGKRSESIGIDEYVSDGFQTAPDKPTYQWLSGEGTWRFLGEGFSGTLSSTIILFGARPAEDDSR